MALVKLIGNKKTTENLVIPKGVNYEQLFYVKDFDGSAINISGFSSYAVRSEMKQYQESVSYAATFVTTISDAYNGIVKISLSSSESSKLKVGRYFYDVILTVESKSGVDIDSDIQTVRVAEGTVVVE